jgi:hypothetical protein
MKDFTLSIPKPCSEKWENFSPTQQGGFCSSCQKEVIDFTSWTDDEIKNYFIQNTTACGRFRPYQLKTYYHKRPAHRFSKWLSLSALGISALLATNTAEASPIKNTKYELVETNVFQRGNLMLPGSSVKTINGIVTDAHDNSPMPGTNVVLKGTTLRTVADADGRFTMTIPEGSSDTLVFSFIGYETAEIMIGNIATFDIKLKPDTAALNELVTVGGVCGRPAGISGLWWKFKNLFRR